MAVGTRERGVPMTTKTLMLTEARLFQKIGDDARKWRFVPRQLLGQYAKSATFLPKL